MRRDQRDGDTFCPCPAGPADTVQIVITTARHVEVDDQIQFVDIQTARRDVRSHQYTHVPLLEALYGQLTVFLVLLAVQDIHTHVHGPEHPIEAVCHDAGIGEDDGLARALVGQDPLEQGLLVGLVVGGDDLLGDGRGVVTDGIEL